MQHLPDIRVMRRAIRAKVCTKCFCRPPASESLSPERARTCETKCVIFLNLPRLRQIVSKTDAPTLAPYERAMRELICQSCHASATSGDFCADRTTQFCTLSRYAGDVVSVLEKLPATLSS